MNRPTAIDLSITAFVLGVAYCGASFMVWLGLKGLGL